VKAYPQKFGFVKNLGKFPEHLCTYTLSFDKASFNINRIEIDRVWRLKSHKIKIFFSSGKNGV